MFCEVSSNTTQVKFIFVVKVLLKNTSTLGGYANSISCDINKNIAKECIMIKLLRKVRKSIKDFFVGKTIYTYSMTLHTEQGLVPLLLIKSFRFGCLQDVSIKKW